MKKLAVFVLFFFLLLETCVSASIVINEVHPVGGEWVEIYNNGSSEVNLTGWYLDDKESDEPLSRTVNASSFLVMIDSDLNCSDLNVSNSSCIKPKGKAIGNGLANGNEELELYDTSENLTDNISWEDRSDTMSLGRLPDGGSWNLSLDPTPGKPNSMVAGNGSDSSTNSSDGNETGSNSTNNSSSPKSRIEILDRPEALSFGEAAQVEVKIFKNGTQKYAVYLRVERNSDGYDVSQETKAYLMEKNTNYTLTLPVLLKPNCERRYGDGEYKLTVEGLGAHAEENVTVSGLSGEACVETEKVKKVTEVKTVRSCPGGKSAKSYEFFPPEKTFENASIKSFLLIRNPEDETENFTVYTYVYDGHKLASEGGWTSNKKTVKLGPSENQIIEMRNKIKPNSSGNYTIKARIRGVKDLTESLEIRKMERVTESEKSETDEEPENRTFQTQTQENSTSEENNTTRTETRVTGEVFNKKSPWEKLSETFSGLLDFIL